MREDVKCADCMGLLDYRIDHEALILGSSVNILTGYHLLFKRYRDGLETGTDPVEALRSIKAQAAAIAEYATKLETLIHLKKRLF